MAGQRFRVGMIGLWPRRTRAAQAHIPAPRALADAFEIAGVANSSRAGAPVDNVVAIFY